MSITSSITTTVSEWRQAFPGALGCPLGKCVPECCTRATDTTPGGACVPVTWGGPRAPKPPCRNSSVYHISRTETTLKHKTKSTFQALGKEVCFTDLLMGPVPGAIHREPICCECQARFKGHLPVPRVEAALPYWVPQSLRPRKQIQKMFWVYNPKATKARHCPYHRFGGRLPMPRSQATMPYWVPQVLRSHKKVMKRLQSFKGNQETFLDSHSWHNHWRICCDGHLFKWRQLQGLHQVGPLARGRRTRPRASLLSFSLPTLFQAVLRVIMVIR